MQNKKVAQILDGTLKRHLMYHHRHFVRNTSYYEHKSVFSACSHSDTPSWGELVNVSHVLWSIFTVLTHSGCFCASPTKQIHVSMATAEERKMKIHPIQEKSNMMTSCTNHECTSLITINNNNKKKKTGPLLYTNTN